VFIHICKQCIYVHNLLTGSITGVSTLQHAGKDVNRPNGPAENGNRPTYIAMYIVL